MLLRDGASGKVREVLENGLVLSSFGEATYFQVELPLAASDWVVLYTDGVTEAKNRSGHQFGLGYLEKFIKDHRAASANEFADQLLDELWHWIDRAGGDELEDDVTFLALHVDGVGTRRDVPRSSLDL